MKIETRIKRFIRRTSSPVVLRAELRRFGGSSQLSVVLRSLQDQGLLVRIGKGVYAKAKHSVLSGKPIPVRSTAPLGDDGRPCGHLTPGTC